MKELIERLQKPEQTIDINLGNGTSIKSPGLGSGSQRKEAAEALLAQQVCIEQMVSIIRQAHGLLMCHNQISAQPTLNLALTLQPSLEALREHDAAIREECAKVCENLYDCGPENGCCPTFWNEALEQAAERIRKGEA